MCVFTVTKGETTATNVVFALFAFGTQPSETLILVLYDDEYISNTHFSVSKPWEYKVYISIYWL